MSPHLVRLVVMFVLSMVVSSGAQQKRNGSQAPVPSSPPSFSTPVAYSTGEPGAIFNGEANTVAIADVNGDGKPDLIFAVSCSSSAFNGCVSTPGSGMVSVLLNNGDGTFQSPETYPSGGYYAVAVLVADINGDGKPDVIVANGCAQEPLICPTEGSVGILLGNGDGTFQPVQTASAGGVPFSMAIADVNKDGKPDVIVGNSGGGSNGDGSVGVLLGTGTAALLQPVQIYDSGDSEVVSIAVADVNNDSNPDILAANLFGSCESCNGSVGVLLGNGNGTFQPAVTYPASGFASGVIVADMNNDGKPDLVVNEGGVFDGGLFGILLGNGDGTFQPAVQYTAGGGYNYLPTVADVNGDHKLDVIAPNGQFCPGFKNGAGCVSVLLGNGDGTLQPPVLYAAGSGVGWLSVADLNGDGIPDIAFAGQGSKTGGNLGVLTGNGDGTFQPAEILGTAGFVSTWVGVMDLNGDGKPDLIVENPNEGGDATLGILLNQTAKSQSTTTTLISSPNPSLVGESVTFSATVSSSSGTPPNGETVTFLNGSSVLGTSSLTSGVATFATAALGVGSHSITASYTGDATFASSTSPVLTQYVNSTTKSATSTSLTSTLNPSIYGQKITFTATVTNNGGSPPTGRVSFTYGTYTLRSPALNSSGVATLTLSALNADTYPLTAVYHGDNNNLSSTSAVVNQVVNQATSSATLTSSPNPSSVGEPVTFTAKITSPTAKPSGPVTFTAGKTTLGTVELTSSGKATFTTSSLAAGETTITATFAGDSDIKGSSASVTQVVQ